MALPDDEEALDAPAWRLHRLNSAEQSLLTATDAAERALDPERLDGAVERVSASSTSSPAAAVAAASDGPASDAGDAHRRASLCGVGLTRLREADVCAGSQTAGSRTSWPMYAPDLEGPWRPHDGVAPARPP